MKITPLILLRFKVPRSKKIILNQPSSFIPLLTLFQCRQTYTFHNKAVMKASEKTTDHLSLRAVATSHVFMSNEKNDTSFNRMAQQHISAQAKIVNVLRACWQATKIILKDER